MVSALSFREDIQSLYQYLLSIQSTLMCVCVAWDGNNTTLPDNPDITGLPCLILIQKCPVVVRVILSVLGLCSHVTLNIIQY